MRVRGVTVGLWLFGMLVAVHSMGSLALAGESAMVPEIDGGSVTAGLGVLAAGILVLRARKAR